MGKGISPLIASVLLLAFTMSVAALSGPFMSNIVKETQEDTGEQADRVVSAANMGLEIHAADFNYTDNELEVTVQNTGDQEVENISIAAFGESAYQKSFGRKLAKKEVEKFRMPVNEDPDITNIRVSLPDYPVKTEKDFGKRYRSCQDLKQDKNPSSGFYGIDPDGIGGKNSFQVYCEMDDNGGGWTRLNLRPKAHKGVEGLAFGEGRDSNSEGAYRWVKDVGDDTGYINLGMSDSELDPNNETRTYGNGEAEAFFQKDSNQRCKKYAIGEHFSDSFRGETTGWDYYDANGNPVPPRQVRALNGTISSGVYYNGTVRAEDQDGPFPDGGDGHGGKNSFSIEINKSATYVPSGGGPIVLWFSTTKNFSKGVTHALGTDYGNNKYLDYTVTWKPVNTMGVPMFMGGKVDNDQNLYSTFKNGCERQSGTEFTFKQPFFYAK
ncbi:MAG: fibrinogen-like YCDxxxxGGGW domain-containing protein [Candidatus Nanohaloarchaea archaeon]